MSQLPYTPTPRAVRRAEAEAIYRLLRLVDKALKAERADEALKAERATQAPG